MGDLDVYKQDEGDRPVEKSPRGRYIRFDIRLGSGAYKTVYKAYDTDQGIDVAWNAIDIGVLPASEKTRIIQEVQLLQKLEHKNIINFYGSWFSKEKNQVVFITEIMTSGNLKSYIKRVHFVKWKIIKRWCIQILEGLHYLHNQNPPVIHRDLKCDNIFINGNTGDLRIGDLGLSTQLAVHKRSKAQSVLGTPEFMAPELYDESYDEKVDIYAFGMCVLEMVTKDVPYSECINPAQIYKKVTAGIRPRGLQRIVSQPARDFIELCLSRGNGKVDVCAEYLLDHPFLKAHDDDGEMVQVLDEDELERATAPAPPVIPEMNPKQFADQLNMESGSKGKDHDAVSERRKNHPSLSLEPEELASGSANTSMTSTAQRNEAPAEEKSAGKHRILLPPTLNTTSTTEADGSGLGRQPSVQGSSVIVSGSTEPIVDEPLSDKKGSDHNVDNFLSGLPPTEANIRNDRIAVMGGRGQRIEIDEAQTYSDDESTQSSTPTVPAQALNASVPPSREPENSTVATPAQSQSSDRSTATAGSTTSEVTMEHRPRTNTIDTTRAGARPPSAKKRGKRYDIKATKDPENDHSILLNLRMALDGKSKEIKFPFNLFTDNSHEVACELAVDVGIPEPDLEDIADSISFLVTEGKINNLSDFDQDVWDEAPEPHSFPSKLLPHVSKLTFESSAASHAIASFVIDGSLPSASQSLVTSISHDSGLRMEGKHPGENSFAVSSPIPFERNVTPPVGGTHMAHAASESALFHPDGSAMLEHSMSLPDTHYMNSVRLSRSSYDERESTLEEEMRSQEEKHQREIERIRMKMQEFNEKTARATMARQERMRLGTDDFRDDSDGVADDARVTNSPQVANGGPDSSQAPAVLTRDGSGTGSGAQAANIVTVKSPRASATLPGALDSAVAGLTLSAAAQTAEPPRAGDAS